MSEKLLSRDDFRNAVFARDQHRCVFCGKAPEETPEGKLDAHHIIERRLFTEPQEVGGYFLSNGATVCEEHHLGCEMTTISVEEVREAAGIRTKVMPSYLYDDEVVTKWGDIILPNGQRTKGPLFDDPSVQKILARGGVLDLYTRYVKYGRTLHLPWSDGINDDDRVMTSLRHFEGQEVVVTEKIDGENTTIYSDYVHARSVDGKSHPSRNLLKAWASQWQYQLSDEQRVCGENAYAQHSIIYTDENPLEHHFLGFSFWEGMTCLDWDTTLDNFEILGIKTVPVLWRGIFDVGAIRALYDPTRDWAAREGYVVRLTKSFHYSQFRTSVAKYVRRNHVQTAKHHWASQPVIPNTFLAA